MKKKNINKPAKAGKRDRKGKNIFVMFTIPAGSTPEQTMELLSKDLEAKSLDIEKLKTEALETKSASDTYKKETEAKLKDVVSSETFKALEKDLEKKRTDFDKLLQTQAEEIAKIEVKRQNNPEQPLTLEKAIAEAIDKHGDDIGKFERKEIRQLNIELKTVGDFGIANVTGSAHWAGQQRAGIIMNPDRKVNIRDLMPTGPAGPGTNWYFLKEDGEGEGVPLAVAENAIKPQMDLDLVEADVKFETIAGWLKLSNKSLKNIPGIVSFLQHRLPKKLLKAEDAYILYGTGSTPQIKGILHADNSVNSTSTAPIMFERIMDDLTLLEDTYERDATGILMRPAQYNSFLLNKAGGSGEYDLPINVSWSNGVLYISGIPVTKTTALLATDYVVGDFQLGAELLFQEGIQIRFFEQDDKNVQYNQTTVRIEEVLAMPVYGETFFIKGTV